MPEREPSLNVDVHELRRFTARHLGWGRDYEALKQDESQMADLNDCLRSAYRAYLYPETLGERHAYDWNFLRPFYIIPVPSAVEDFDMPPDFQGDSSGQWSFSQADRHQWYPATVRPPEYVVARRQNAEDWSGQPFDIAFAPERITPDRAQQWKGLLFPIPDADYLLKGRFKVVPQELSDEHPWPYGSASTVEALLAACKWKADAMFNDDSRGSSYEEFVAALASARSADSATRGRFLGYNGNGGGRRMSAAVDRSIRRHCGGLTIRYEGG